MINYWSYSFILYLRLRLQHPFILNFFVHSHFSHSFLTRRVFGAKPLEDVLKNIRSVIVQDLEIALAQQAPNTQNDDPSLFELPPLVIDGIPTPVDKMAQQQLRMFIPHMLKYSTGRGKPGETIVFEWIIIFTFELIYNCVKSWA